MPTRNVSLTTELDRFVETEIQSGRFENASEVIRAGLRSLEREEQQEYAKITALRVAIQAGLDSGVVEGDAFARVRDKLKLEKRS
jgi:antitoxin ParD1/3/4